MNISSPSIPSPGISVHLLQFTGNIYTNQTVTFLALLWSINPLDVEWSIFPTFYSVADTSRNKLKLIFYESGTYTVTASSRAQNVSDTKEVPVLPCRPPVLKLIGPNDVKTTRSTPLHLAVAVETCPLHPVAHKWEVMDGKLNMHYNFSSSVNKVLSNTSTLYLSPRILSLGKYSIKFTSTYKDTGEFSVVHLNLTICPSAPKAVISGGDERKVAAIDEIVLDGSLSFDPDKSLSENQDLLYSWYCRDGVRLCFESSSDSPMTLLPSNYLKPNRQYTFFLRVRSKSSASKSSYTKQILRTEKCKLPQAAIECASCIDSAQYHLSYFHVLRLSGRCYGTLCDEQISYTWSISNDSETLPMENISTTGAHAKNLVINKFVFHNELPYIFELQITRNNTLVGSAVMKLKRLPLPLDKYCTTEILPRVIVVALVDVIKIACSGYIGLTDTPNSYKAQVARKNYPHLSYIAYEGPNGNLSFYVAPFLGNFENLIVRVFVVDKFGSHRLVFEKPIIVITPLSQAEDHLVDFFNEHLTLIRVTNNFKETLPNIIAFLLLLNNACKMLVDELKNDTFAQFQTDSRQNIMQHLNDYMTIKILSDFQQLALLTKLLTECHKYFPDNKENMDEMLTILGSMVVESRSYISMASDGSEIVPNILYSACENLWNNIFNHIFDQNVFDLLNELNYLLEELGHISVSIISAILDIKVIGEKETLFNVGEVFVFGNKSQSSQVAQKISYAEFEIHFDSHQWHNQNVHELMHGFVTYRWTKFNMFEESTSIFLFKSFFKNYSTDIMPEIPFNLTVLTKATNNFYIVPKEVNGKYANLSNTSSFSLYLEEGKELLIYFPLPQGNFSLGLNVRLSLTKITSLPIPFDIQISKLSSNNDVKLEHSNHLMLLRENSSFDLISSREVKDLNINSVKITVRNDNNSIDSWVNVTINSIDCFSTGRACGVTSANETHVTCMCIKSSAVQVVRVPYQTDFLVITLGPSSFSGNLMVFVTACSLGMFFIIGSILTYLWDESSKDQKIILFGNYDENLYLVTILTGSSFRAGTTANVGLKICGENKDTNEIHLKIPGAFKKDSQTTFFVATKDHLGNIKSIQVWHDNSGAHPPWKLFWIFVKDIKRGKSYHFGCQCTLSITHSISRSFFPLGKPTLLSKLSLELFYKMKEQHIMYSVIKCLPCGVMGHMMRFMVVSSSLSIMSFSMALYFRHFASNTEDVHNNLKDNLLRDVLACLTISLFAWCLGVILSEASKMVNSKALKTKQKTFSNFETESQNWLIQENENPSMPESLLDLQIQNASSCESTDSKNNVLVYLGEKINVFTETEASKIRNCGNFPKQNKHVSWAFATAILMCLLLTAVLGKDFSSDTSMRWFYALIGGGFIVLFILETIRIYSLATIRALSQISPGVHFESVNDNFILIKQVVQSTKIKPLGGFSLSQAKNRHKRRENFQYIIKSLVIHILLILNVMAVMTTTTDNKTHMEFRETMQKHFDFTENFVNIKISESMENIWTWVDLTAREIFLLLNEDAGNPIVFFKPVQFRQIRSTPIKCILDNKLPHSNKMCMCNPGWLQDNNQYMPGWTPSNNTFYGENGPWTFKSADHPHMYSIKGRFGTYRGEGFSVLIKNSSHSQKILRDLKNQTWLDKRTKAAFFELVAYSPGLDLFASIVVGLETSCSGFAYSINSFEFVQLFDMKSQRTFAGLLSCAFLIPISICLIFHYWSKQNSKIKKLHGIVKIIFCWISTSAFILVVLKDTQAHHNQLKNPNSFESLRETCFYHNLMKSINLTHFTILISETIGQLHHLSTFYIFSKTLVTSMCILAKVSLVHLSIFTVISTINYFMVPTTGSYSPHEHVDFSIKLFQQTSLAGSTNILQPTFALSLTILKSFFFGYSLSTILQVFKNIKQKRSLIIQERQLLTNTLVQEFKQMFSQQSHRPAFQRVQFQEELIDEIIDIDDNISIISTGLDTTFCCHSFNESVSSLSANLVEDMLDPFFAISVLLDVTEYRLDYLISDDNHHGE